MRTSADGMPPGAFNRVSPRFTTPVFTTILCGAAGGIVAALPIDVLGELVSIGTLRALMIVCAGVLVLGRMHARTLTNETFASLAQEEGEV